MSTAIEWTDETWNPSLGCSRVSPGCVNCYAETFVHRGLTPSHRGLTVLREKAGIGWTGEVRFLPERLDVPLHWRKPRRVFVNSLSDLFHEKLTNEQIAAVFGVMAAAPRHTFQVLTKRPERMREWFRWLAERAEDDGSAWTTCLRETLCEIGEPVGNQLLEDGIARDGMPNAEPWPLPNVWLGVSVEDQQRADERIPLLLETPAAVRFVSYEPALGPVDFTHVLGDENELGVGYDVLRGEFHGNKGGGPGPRIDWIIVGGESGHGARPFDLAWARSTVKQCRDAGVACFVKQLGALRGGHGADAWIRLRDRKDGDMSEWPEELQVREFPGAS